MLKPKDTTDGKAPIIFGKGGIVDGVSGLCCKYPSYISRTTIFRGFGGLTEEQLREQEQHNKDGEAIMREHRKRISEKTEAQAPDES